MNTVLNDPFDFPVIEKAKAAHVITRHITCSTARAREFLQTLNPETIRWSEPVMNSRIGARTYSTAADILQMEGSLAANYRYEDVQIDLDPLSPLARELAEYAQPRNQSRANDYHITFTRSVADVNAWPEHIRRAYGGDQPYATAFHWPCLMDGETGVEYYERCAKLISLSHALIEAAIKLDRIRSVMSEAERWHLPWTITEIVQRELGNPNWREGHPQ